MWRFAVIRNTDHLPPPRPLPVTVALTPRCTTMAAWYLLPASTNTCTPPTSIHVIFFGVAICSYYPSRFPVFLYARFTSETSRCRYTANQSSIHRTIHRSVSVIHSPFPIQFVHWCVQMSVVNRFLLIKNRYFR